MLSVLATIATSIEIISIPRRYTYEMKKGEELQFQTYFRENTFNHSFQILNREKFLVYFTPSIKSVQMTQLPSYASGYLAEGSNNMKLSIKAKEDATLNIHFYILPEANKADSIIFFQGSNFDFDSTNKSFKSRSSVAVFGASDSLAQFKTQSYMCTNENGYYSYSKSNIHTGFFYYQVFSVSSNYHFSISSRSSSESVPKFRMVTSPGLIVYSNDTGIPSKPTTPGNLPTEEYPTTNMPYTYAPTEPNKPSKPYSKPSKPSKPYSKPNKPSKPYSRPSKPSKPYHPTQKPDKHDSAFFFGDISADSGLFDEKTIRAICQILCIITFTVIMVVVISCCRKLCCSHSRDEAAIPATLDQEEVPQQPRRNRRRANRRQPPQRPQIPVPMYAPMPAPVPAQNHGGRQQQQHPIPVLVAYPGVYAPQGVNIATNPYQ